LARETGWRILGQSCFRAVKKEGPARFIEVAWVSITASLFRRGPVSSEGNDSLPAHLDFSSEGLIARTSQSPWGRPRPIS